MNTTIAAQKSKLPRGVKSAFTIVELLIVVVVIATLAAITVVAYNGITGQAKDSALKNDLSTTAKKVGLIQVEQGSYPTTKPSDLPSYIQYSQTDTGQGFCAAASKDGKTFHITQVGSIQEGECPPPPAIAIQAIDSTNCPVDRTVVVDARDNNTYYIQKIGTEPNARCWMLTNLAYAGGGSNTYNDTIPTGNGSNGTLNGPDNAGATTYTLAKYYTPTGANPTISPTLPSTDTAGGGSGVARQYGYLYNWCAAMGAQNNPSGTNTAACANATTPAPDTTKSICPAGWRLPTYSPTNEFTLLNNAINGGLINTDAGLRTAWLGQYGGSWYGGFYDQGSYSLYWSSTQNTATNSRYLGFGSSFVNLSNNDVKPYGFSVRCVAA